MTRPTGKIIRAGHVCVMPGDHDPEALPGAIFRCYCGRRWQLMPNRQWYRRSRRWIAWMSL